jgi:hypothetical protein
LKLENYAEGEEAKEETSSAIYGDDLLDEEGVNGDSAFYDAGDGENAVSIFFPSIHI